MVTTKETAMPDLHHWLDKYIVEQAKAYGMTVEQHAEFRGSVNDYQELIDTHQVPEPPKDNT